MARVYVLDGPASAGNAFGFFKHGLVPAGCSAVVADGEYANGGHGPSTVDGKSYASREAAEAVASALNEERARKSVRD